MDPCKEEPRRVLVQHNSSEGHPLEPVVRCWFSTPAPLPHPHWDDASVLLPCPSRPLPSLGRSPILFTALGVFPGPWAQRQVRFLKSKFTAHPLPLPDLSLFGTYLGLMKQSFMWYGLPTKGACLQTSAPLWPPPGDLLRQHLPFFHPPLSANSPPGQLVCPYTPVGPYPNPLRGV